MLAKRKSQVSDLPQDVRAKSDTRVMLAIRDIAENNQNHQGEGGGGGGGSWATGGGGRTVHLVASS